MTPERFEALAEAYGGDPARWPATERDAAAALMADRPAWAQAVLAEAAALDGLLSALPAPRAPAELVARIVRGAPAPRRPWRRWFVPAAMGAGLAAATAAGVLVGVQLGAADVAPSGDAMVAGADDEAFNLYLDEEVG